MMNCPSRVDPEILDNGWNQSPNALALHKKDDLNRRANLVQQRDHRIPLEQPPDNSPCLNAAQHDQGKPSDHSVENHRDASCPAADEPAVNEKSLPTNEPNTSCGPDQTSSLPRGGPAPNKRFVIILRDKLVKYSRFVGPGFLVSVAYIDPGNYATDVAAGASYRFRLLVMILVSNIIAIFLQSLAIRLGSVTGLNLAENCRVHCPRWLNYFLCFFGEAAIIATDIAEVIGTAIALNLLLNIPLVAGCAISIVDVLIILAFYRPSGSMRGLRIFELFVMVLVLGVVICFCVMLSLIDVPDLRHLFRGYLPSHAIVESQGLYQACGILGATVMPHGLYLGSGIVQPRLKEYDAAHGTAVTSADNDDDEDEDPSTRNTSITKYRPSLEAIRSCMSWSIAELAISLFTFALFVNSAILIVAGATLFGTPDADNASLFDIHTLFSQSLAPFAGTIFALALLLSGTSAGIVCTIAGQMISEGQLGWRVRPWVRRLMTRSISIVPSIVVAGAIGKDGVSAALEASQVALSVILPFTSAPLIWFTCRNRYMTVRARCGNSTAEAGRSGTGAEGGASGGGNVDTPMRNHVVVAAFGVLLWGLIVVMNVALLVLVGLGKA